MDIKVCGKCKKNGEWITGYLWVDTPFYCIDKINPKYYIRRQRNFDWGLWTQEDFEVYPETIKLIDVNLKQNVGEYIMGIDYGKEELDRMVNKK